MHFDLLRLSLGAAFAARLDVSVADALDWLYPDHRGAPILAIPKRPLWAQIRLLHRNMVWPLVPRKRT
jgi:hypothetical protein